MSQQTLNYYKILQLQKTASIEEIKKSYRKLVLKYHPDLNKEITAVNKLQDVIKAYKILSDPEKRSEYDKTFKIYSSFPNLKKNKEDKPSRKQNNKHKTNENGNIFTKIRIGFRVFRTRLSNTFTKQPELITADKKLLKIPIKELRERFYSSENKYVRCEALKALTILVGKKAYQEIEKGFYDISKDVRLVSINAIGYLRIRQGLRHLERLYNSSSSTLRKAIVVSVTRMNNERSKKIILSACQDKDHDIRIEALKSFKRLNMGEHINKISYLVYDRNEEVRKLARELYETHKELAM